MGQLLAQFIIAFENVFKCDICSHPLNGKKSKVKFRKVDGENLWLCYGCNGILERSKK